MINKISSLKSSKQQNDFYTLEDSSLQNTLDIFEGAWASQVPGASAEGSGYADLFEDSRIQELGQRCGGFQGKAILEIGPLEAAHSYMMVRAGAQEVTSVEANSQAYLKSLIIKEEFNLSQLQLKFADAMKFLASNTKKYDLSVASGVLYHMSNPLQFIKDLTRSSDQVFIWTHYYVDDMTNTSRPKFSGQQRLQLDGIQATAHQYFYGHSLSLKSFCGGTKPYTLWLSREDILDAFAHFGMTKHQVFQEDLNHPNGPCFCVLFEKS